MSSHPFFTGLGDQHLRLLAEGAHRVHFPQGSFIFREGEMANRFYLIQRGQVAIESSAGGCDPMIVQTLGEGDVLGWSWLFPPFTWHFDARAVEKTDAIFLAGTRLRELCETDPALGFEVMQRIAAIVVQRLQGTRRKLSTHSISPSLRDAREEAATVA